MMRRIALTAIAFALVAVTGYAKAPTFGDLPDVIISDQEKNEEEGFTFDFNFFEYMNAFDVLTYAQDEDSSPANDLKFIFTTDVPEQPDLQINGKDQLDQGTYDPTDPATWPAGSLIIPAGQGSAGDFTVSFRDMIRSPGTSEGPFPDPLYEEGGAAVTSGDTGIYLPWRNAAGQLVRTPDANTPSRMVTIWAGDEDDNPGSGSLMVYSVNETADDLSGLMATIFSDDLVGLNTDDWITETFTGLTAATSGATGQLSLQAAAFTGANYTYTRWRLRNYGELAVKPVIEGVPTPYSGWVPIEYVPDDSLIYSGRFSIQHNQATLDTVPSMRFGIHDALFYQVALTFVGTIPNASGAFASVNSQWPAANTTKVFRQYWANNPGPGEAGLDLGDGSGSGGLGGDMRNFAAFYDLLNRFQNGVGTLTMVGPFEVVTMPRPANGTLVAHTPATDYVQEQVNTGSPVASGAAAGNALRLTVPASTSGGTVPFILYTNYDAVQMAVDSLVRVRVELSCPVDTDRTNFKQFRLRFNTPYSNQDQLVYIQQLDPTFAGVVGYPSLPPSQQSSPGATAFYDAYMPVFPSDLSVLQGLGDPDGAGPRANSDYFGIGLDYVGNPAINTTASTVTIHSVTHEVLAMPAM